MREASRRVAQRIQASGVGTDSEGGVESTGVGDHRAGLHGSDLITCGDFFVSYLRPGAVTRADFGQGVGHAYG